MAFPSTRESFSRPTLAEHRGTPTALLWGRPSRRVDVHSFDPALALLGRVLDDRFELTSILGRGGMGIVYDAFDRLLERPVVVKMIAPHSADPSASARLMREAKLACRVQHPCIVTVFHLGLVDDRCPYVVMERLEGQDLASHLDGIGLPLSLEHTLDLLEPVADALAALHAAGIVHRDVKPENVFVLAGPGAVRRLKLIDFGLAMLGAASLARLTQTGRLLGTAEYMAPEAVSGAVATPASDVYALASMVFELLTGELPFPGSGVGVLVAKTRLSPSRVAERIAAPWAERVDEILACALDRDPEVRPTATDLIAALRAI